MGVVVGREQGLVQEGRALKVLGVVGWSGSGKTTLIEQLLPQLSRDGRRVGYLKGDRHGIEMDREGKDTDRVFRAGAVRVAIAGPDEGVVRFRLQERDPHALLAEFFSGCDLVVVEGFKRAKLPRIEVRGVHGDPILAADDPDLLAVVSDLEDTRPVPRFARDDIAGVARFVETALLS